MIPGVVIRAIQAAARELDAQPTDGVGCVGHRPGVENQTARESLTRPTKIRLEGP